MSEKLERLRELKTLVDSGMGMKQSVVWDWIIEFYELSMRMQIELLEKQIIKEEK